MQIFQVFGDDSYLEHARKSADCIWERGLLRKGYGLCHGTAGNGYALLYFYQVTKEPDYLYRAAQFARWCRDYGKHGCRTPDRPLSLFEAQAGTSCLTKNKVVIGNWLPTVEEEAPLSNIVELERLETEVGSLATVVVL
ncbi:lanC-like protein 2 [Macrobrachium nipponense]|uniref:lanC-like protein 2 n=1 Tax=Macrobrachium nipponense TaxID=159736 RepID=UPI0030C7C381